VGPRADLDGSENLASPPLRPPPSGNRSADRRYTNYAIPAHLTRVGRRQMYRHLGRKCSGWEEIRRDNEITINRLCRGF
jgi:hypothetical protein